MNGRRNAFMTKSPRKNVPDVGIELGAACVPSELASDRATAPGLMTWCNHLENPSATVKTNKCRLYQMKLQVEASTSSLPPYAK